MTRIGLSRRERSGRLFVYGIVGALFVLTVLAIALTLQGGSSDPRDPSGPVSPQEPEPEPLVPVDVPVDQDGVEPDPVASGPDEEPARVREPAREPAREPVQKASPEPVDDPTVESASEPPAAQGGTSTASQEPEPEPVEGSSVSTSEPKPEPSVSTSEPEPSDRPTVRAPGV